MKKIKTEIKWAVIFALMMLLWMALEKITGLHDANIEYHPVATNFVAIPAILVYVFALLDKRRNYYGGKMNYLQGLITGLIITLFVTILSPLTQYITSEVISPDYFANMIEYTVEQGKMTRDEAEAYFNLNSYLSQVLIFTPIIGIFTSAIVAIFTRKK
jgi:hypothetical protein